MADQLIIRGAREHNLKDVSLDLPRDSLIVFTGLSGSGKSSLAFDTIFAEGQRRYVESLSAYARQFLGQMDKPDVDFIEGLSPAVSIDQKSTSKNPRSTVGTITEVYDYLRLLYARAGRAHCPTCGAPIERQTPQQIVDRILALEEGRRFQVLAPVIRGRKGEYVELFRQLQQQGFSRARVDGQTHSLDEPPTLDKKLKHTIEVVVDRLAVKESSKRRLTDSVETALGLAGGLVVFDFVDLDAKDPGREMKFSEKMACPNDHTIDTDDLEPRSFSFNSPFGACTVCSGLGTKMEVDPELVVPDTGATLGEGAIAPWSGAHVADYFLRLVNALGEELGFDLNTPWDQLSPHARTSLLEGHKTKVHVVTKNRYGRQRAYYAAFEGVRPYVERRHREAESDTSRERFEGFMREVPCPACQGTRLKPVSVSVTLGARDQGGKNIAEVCAMSIDETADYLRTVELSARERQIGERVLKEIQERLRFLLDVGLDYLSLDRPSGSLSGGEAQRIRLATQIGAGLVGVLYVLDEPSIGLHQRDNKRLIETLLRLKDLGNTLIVVEHDEETVRVADWVVDIGPGAGEHGGQVVHSGSVEDLLTHPDSMTGQYLSGRREIPVPAVRRPRTVGRELTVHGAREHNLQNVDVSFPLGVFTAVTGVSGSGKSTLVNDILYTSLAKQIYNARTVPGRHTKITGLEHVDKVIHVDQSPIGRTPRSNPATYTGRLRPHPPALRLDSRGQDARLPPGSLLVQRQGRALRGLLRRRHDQDRDELPAGRLRPVRGVPRRPLQPRDARGPLQGQDHRRGPRHADRGGRRLLRGRARDRAPHEHARRGRPRLRPPRPARHHPVRRRGAARQAGQRAAEAVDRSHGLRPRRAHHRPALRGHPQAAPRPVRAGRQGQQRPGDRAQPRRHQDRRLAHRHGSRGRLARRLRRRRGHARAGRGRSRRATPAPSSSRSSRVARPSSPAARSSRSRSPDRSPRRPPKKVAAAERAAKKAAATKATAKKAPAKKAAARRTSTK